ncbi:hypothetical protein [Romboutsia sp. 13368]|uniref:hypothetical protein n=1 Tax=Romboutsia sp. 13368 TaxID=2708053 RepID=UPI0025CBDF5B|nr:hypothetical protein [Romboutsia sp. 13368]
MAKKRKLKKSVLVGMSIVVFFIVYGIAFYGFTYLENKDKPKTEVSEETKEDNRDLMTQLKSKKKIYMSSGDIKNIKVEEIYWDEIKYELTKLSKVRNQEKFTPTYTGYSDDGIRFSTDLDFFRIYTVNQEVYYKVPVAEKNKLDTLLNGSICTSFDFVKQYKTWKSVEISYNNKTKTIHKWKYDDLVYKMSAKRTVGKVQPEKNKDRSKYNFIIDIKGDNYDLKVETMGPYYVKISSNKGMAYYEVSIALYEYLRDEIFKLPVESDSYE